MSPTHHHQQQRRNSVNANSDTSTDGPWQCSTPLVRICTVGTINDVAGKDPHGKILWGLYSSKTLHRLSQFSGLGYHCSRKDPKLYFQVAFLWDIIDGPHGTCINFDHFV